MFFCSCLSHKAGKNTSLSGVEERMEWDGGKHGDNSEHQDERSLKVSPTYTHTPGSFAPGQKGEQGKGANAFLLT